MRVLVSVALLGGVLLSAGCSDRTGPVQTPSSTAAVITDAPAGNSAQDTAFGAALLQLQQQATGLAGLAKERAADPELVTLADTIATGQRGESDTIKALMVQWSDGSGPPAAPSAATPGALDPATLSRLESLRGPEFDTLWLQSMIGLHRGVIGLAEAEISGGRNIDAQTLAKSILNTRQAQLQQMQQMVG
ncbi:uncharacterized protein RMCC_6693 [Mycolicibacterium canariasense]|uniref:DUF305 domain-containing protein n=1 Tax=Mycolicibacterium canariasense TaxID=228230 RepID=A0A100WKX7_MYCCR|nr:DUF305 domain-containing protein [Mycolicibacterium canariasense]MCV7207616.1 DUF305 domain-containing protein [Mycolicibacterium canariasense]GAS99728.1 uncharacterized protein RMCC_6693 [Mycolicibacterium canariasense]